MDCSHVNKNVGYLIIQTVKDDMSIQFRYDHNGLRIGKIVTENGVATTTNYTLHGKLITHMTVGSDNLHFFYDAQSRPAKVNYNGNIYTYLHNLQGDIVGILDNAGNLVVEYKYDAWGKPLATTGSLAATLGKRNPFRYRGYVYDEETELYYLRSRYYNPATGRFVNADDENVVVDIENSILEENLFGYCLSNPTNYIDEDGDSALAIGGGLVASASGVTVTNWWNPAGWAAAVLVGTLIIALASTNPDPYARPNQKKQGRERKSKARKSDKWKPRSNPRPPKKHTPGREHRKYGLTPYSIPKQELK